MRILLLTNTSNDVLIRLILDEIRVVNKALVKMDNIDMEGTCTIYYPSIEAFAIAYEDFSKYKKELRELYSEVKKSSCAGSHIN